MKKKLGYKTGTSKPWPLKINTHNFIEKWAVHDNDYSYYIKIKEEAK